MTDRIASNHEAMVIILREQLTLMLAQLWGWDVRDVRLAVVVCRRRTLPWLPEPPHA